LIGASHLEKKRVHLAENRLLAVTAVTHVVETGNHYDFDHNWEITNFAEFSRLSGTHCAIQHTCHVVVLVMQQLVVSRRNKRVLLLFVFRLHLHLLYYNMQNHLPFFTPQQI
jgi:hypothetical protein